MFYNINDGTIEDLTGFGISDLENKIARTPLDPLTTFTDDPLRVLRTIRFVSRFQLSIVDAVRAALTNSAVFQALYHKISRERIAKEFFLMIKGKNHLKSLEYLMEFQLFPVIFKIPKEFPDLLNSGYMLVQRIQRNQCEENLLLYTAGILIEYAVSGEYSILYKKNTIKLYEYICTENIKMSNHEISVISNILKNIENCKNCLLEFQILKMAEILRETKEN